MGRMFMKLQPPIAPPNIICSGKTFVKELSVLSGNNSPEALETNSIVNESIVKWLWSALFDKYYLE